MKQYEKFAEILVNYSCKLKKGEKVFIEHSEVDPKFLEVLIKQVFKQGAYPFLFEKNIAFDKILISKANQEWCHLKTKYYLPIMQDMDAYINLRGSKNPFELSDIPSEQADLYRKHFIKPVHFEERVNNTKWVLANWPTPSLAQSANMSTDRYTDLFFKVCNLNYGKMSQAMDNLVKLMQKTDMVRIISPNTDICFSIKNQPAIKCAGENNIPDGEVFTAPLKNTINGVITFNMPTTYDGIKFENICLTVVDGKITNATASTNNRQLNQILDTDEGARFFGEFAIGVNPYITQPTGDILFDEKMCGSIHLTPGDSYEECPNGNNSAIHWDMVLCQLEEFGGGDIYFDNKLIRRNGIFVIEELKNLNPENLIGE